MKQAKLTIFSIALCDSLLTHVDCHAIIQYEVRQSSALLPHRHEGGSDDPSVSLSHYVHVKIFTVDLVTCYCAISIFVSLWCACAHVRRQCLCRCGLLAHMHARNVNMPT